MFEFWSRSKQKQNIFSALKQPSGFYNTLRHGAWLSLPLPALPHLIVYCSFILLGSLMACNPWQTHSGKYVLVKKDQWTNEHSVTVEGIMGKSYVLPGYVNT